MERGIQGVTRREQPKLPITKSVARCTIWEFLQYSQKYNYYFSETSLKLAGISNIAGEQQSSHTGRTAFQPGLPGRIRISPSGARVNQPPDVKFVATAVTRQLAASVLRANSRVQVHVLETIVCVQTQPVGLGSPPYLVIGFIGPVIHILNIAFWSSPMNLENLRIGGTTACSS